MPSYTLANDVLTYGEDCDDICFGPSPSPSPPPESELIWCCWYLNEQSRPVCLKQSEICPLIPNFTFVNVFQTADFGQCDSFCAKG